MAWVVSDLGVNFLRILAKSKASPTFEASAAPAATLSSVSMLA